MGVPATSRIAFNVAVSAVCLCAIATVANGASSPPAEVGLASVYSTHFNGKITASGERYDGKLYTERIEPCHSGPWSR
jgi:rare lipoprotein A (peptidoglycan hydrolase)